MAIHEKINFLKFFFESEKYADNFRIAEAIADFFPALVFVYDRDLKRIQYANQNFKEYFGLNSENVSYSDHLLENIAYPEDKKLVLENIYNHSENDSQQFVCRLVDKQYGFRYFNTTANVIKNTSSENSLVLFIAQDITDKMRIEEEIGIKKELFDETEALLQFGSWNWDPVTNHTAWTAGMYKLLGYEVNEVHDQAGFDFYLRHVLPEYAAELKRSVEEGVNNGTDFDYEYDIKTKSGEIKTVSTKGKAILGEDGRVKKICGITRDITSMRIAARDQERSLCELNRSNKELEEFAYIASHDLQEPLRKISMFSERLRTKHSEGLDKEGQLFMSRIVASADNMRTLIDNLLEFSRANRSSNAFTKTDLNDILQKVLTNLDLKIEETKASIEVTSLLPIIKAVPSEMEQLFSNVICNAIKFGKESESPAIRIDTRKLTLQEKQHYRLSSDAVCHAIEFKDNGIGFEAEYEEKIFMIFQRLHGKKEYPGSGIGLAICKRIVDNHHGVIYARSLPGEGSTFTIILPENQY
jgi:PAS domain S-box-containing protein